MPFIFVSGVVGEDFATNALKRGATDYVIKRNLARAGTAVTRALEQARDARHAMRGRRSAAAQRDLVAAVDRGGALGLWESTR